MSVTVAYLTFPEFTSLDRAQRSDRLGGLVHEYRVAAQCRIHSENAGPRRGPARGAFESWHSSPVPDGLASLG